MADALPSRARSRRNASPVTKVHHAATKQASLPSMAGARSKRVALKASAVAKLRAGTEQLTQAATAFAGSAPSTEDDAPLSAFRDAYAAIVASLPKSHRLALLDTMRQGIDAVAEQERQITRPASRVTTEAFMASLRHQEQEQLAADLASGRLLSSADMRRRLQVSPQALSAALKTKRMFALLGPSGEYAYPAFFADAALDRRTVERVCQALGELPATSKWNFFTSPRLSLGNRSPLQALAKGKVNDVLDAASAFMDE